MNFFRTSRLLKPLLIRLQAGTFKPIKNICINLMNKKVTGKVRNSLETYESALSCSAGECRGLDQDQIKAIVQLQVAKLGERLAAKDLKLQLGDSAVEFLADRGFDPAFGARPVKRALQRYLESPLAKGMLREDFGEGDTVVVSAPGGASARELALERLPAADGAAVAPAGDEARREGRQLLRSGTDSLESGEGAFGSAASG